MVRVTKVTRDDLDADILIESGTSIYVHGIVVANSHTTAVEIDFQTGSGTTKFTVTVPAQDSKLIDWPFIADGGLNVDALSSNGTSVFVSVWHSAAGA